MSKNSMPKTTPEQNKALVLEAFDTLFNRRDYGAAERFWSERYIQHSAHIAAGRDGLFNLILQRLRAHFERLNEAYTSAHFGRGCLLGNFSAELADQSQVIRERLADLYLSWSTDIAAGEIRRPNIRRNVARSRRHAPGGPVFMSRQMTSKA